MNEILLVGCPNVGKTTLFNSLTGKHEKASNWHGVTVGVAQAHCKIKGKTYLVSDLPGMYSLQGSTEEEKIASDYLMKHKDDIIINVCDANNLKQNIKLTVELVSLGFKMLLAVNMSNENKMKNPETLSKALQIPVVLIDARKKKSVSAIFNILSQIQNQKIQFKNVISSKNIPNYDILNSIFDNSLKKNTYEKSDKIDKLVLNKFLFFPIFLAVVFLVFYLTFGSFGEFISSAFEYVFSVIFEFLSDFIYSLNMSFVLQNFLVDGVLNSIFSVLSFVPQILMLMLFVGLLEDIGFMSRVAFMFDGFLKKIGLSGKSLFSLMMGYGCTASAVLTTRNLENNSLKKRTALLLPFSTCSAKLPVFLVISSLFFDKYKYVFVFLLYIFAIVIMVISALIFKRLIKPENDEFVLELPKYRLPYFRKIITDASRVLAEFLVKVGTIILIFGSAMWLLQNFSVNFEYLQGADFDKSILYFLCNKLAIIFKPIGLGSAGIVAALVFGLVAKEMVVVGLTLINGVQGAGSALTLSLMSASSPCNFTPVTSIVFLLFVLLYSPCISALGTIKSEFGLKFSIFVFLYQFFTSFLVCFAFFNILTNQTFLVVFLSVCLLVFFVWFVLKLCHKKKHCGGKCIACYKIYGNKK